MNCNCSLFDMENCENVLKCFPKSEYAQILFKSQLSAQESWKQCSIFAKVPKKYPVQSGQAYIQYTVVQFRKGLSFKSVKAYATMPKGIISSRTEINGATFTETGEESMHTCIGGFPFIRVKSS